MRPIDGDKLYADLKDAGMVFALRMVAAAPTITPPPNDPLTSEELREMDGEPVWVVEGTLSYHALVSGVLDAVAWLITRWDDHEMRTEDYGETWLAYRRKPEEGKEN